MNYRQEIHGQLSIPAVDELMQEAERKKRMEAPSAIPVGIDPWLPPGATIRTTEPMTIGPCGVGADQLAAEKAALAEGMETDGPLDPVYSEEEKVRRARESWEYNKMTQDLQGEIPPGWSKSEDSKTPLRFSDLPEYPPMREWSGVKITGPGTSEAAVEDEALRREIRDALAGLESEELEASIRILQEKVPELLGRYETLFALAETYAGACPVDSNGVYRSQRPKENIPGTDKMED